MPDDALSDPLDPAFVHDLRAVSLPELRRRRDRANQRETVYSYVRRLIQGPLDIIDAEMSRRKAGEAPGDVSDLVDKLPSILGDQIHAPGFGRLPEFLTPGEVDEALVGRIDAIVSTNELSDLPRLSDARIEGVVADLGAFEREVSDSRHALQAVVDQIKAEVVRRYRDGEATVDGLP